MKFILLKIILIEYFDNKYNYNNILNIIIKSSKYKYYVMEAAMTQRRNTITR